MSNQHLYSRASAIAHAPKLTALDIDLLGLPYLGTACFAVPARIPGLLLWTTSPARCALLRAVADSSAKRRSETKPRISCRTMLISLGVPRFSPSLRSPTAVRPSSRVLLPRFLRMLLRMCRTRHCARSFGRDDFKRGAAQTVQSRIPVAQAPQPPLTCSHFPSDKWPSFLAPLVLV